MLLKSVVPMVAFYAGKYKQATWMVSVCRFYNKKINMGRPEIRRHEQAKFGGLWKKSLNGMEKWK
jgi:hypothetical protein